MDSSGDLHFFCGYIVKRYGSPDAASEDEKAEEFRNIYLRNLSPDLRGLKAIAAACGINLNRLEGGKLPKNLRGYHDVFDGKKNIYYKKDDSISGIENTILHEFREMIEPIFVEVCPEYEPLRTIAVHLAANRFAAAVLLPRKPFEDKVYETGLDVIALAKFYSKSCSQVLLRVGEVLQGKLFFYAALYENTSQTEPDWKVTYWTGGWNEEYPEANVHGLDGFFPRRGHSVVPDSLVDMAIRTRKAHLVPHITILDDMEDDGFVAMAQPLVLSRAKPSKVGLVVLLQEDKATLGPQIERTEPIIIEHFYKHL